MYGKEIKESKLRAESVCEKIDYDVTYADKQKLNLLSCSPVVKLTKCPSVSTVIL